MAAHSSVLAWKIPWTGQPGGLQSMGSRGVGHNTSNLTHIHNRIPLYILETQHCKSTTLQLNKFIF